MELLVAGLIVFLLCAFCARFIAERALQTLPDDQKLRLVNAFSSMRTYGLLWAVGLLGAMFLLLKAFPEDRRTGLYLGLGLALVFIVTRQVITARKISELRMEP